MVKHIENLFSVQRNASSEGDSYRAKENHEHRILQRLGENFPVFLFSCVQIASKLASYSSALDNRSVSGLLHSLGISCPKQKLLKSELLILKTLDFQLSVPNPLLYVETLLEVLGHNDPSIRVPQLHRVCRCVLQFIFLQREKIYQSLLEAATGSHSPSSEQRAKFASVTEDCMLLGVGVIAVSAFFSHRAAWKEVAKELALITGISVRSIINFAQMTLAHIT
ncbi:cyclin N-terminal domain-containing protein 1 isoform X2 [Hoplias malabaricus]